MSLLSPGGFFGGRRLLENDVASADYADGTRAEPAVFTIVAESVDT